MWKKKHGRSRQATDENIIRRMRFTSWINKARIHRVIAVSTYGFSIATTISRKRVIVTIYLSCLSCYNFPFFMSSVAELSIRSSVEFSYNERHWSNEIAARNYVIYSAFIKLLPQAWSFVYINLLYENLIVFLRNVNTHSTSLLLHRAFWRFANY
jgi:hypothetical protein